ncbi:MAG: glycosyltransferase [Verrucomicrobiae bacterium]|nr:glycosyltransferase [Verrucomicrobiae bacterium]
MISNRLYYRFKPYIPWSFRMAARRVLARRQRRSHADTWPINEAAGRIPEGWPGWPGGKKFALVLTHDVESSSGLAKVRDLMRLEKSLGFRSSFNFIPEGEYRVAPELRAELAEAGFEVGVHDLRHDGKLYWPRSDFSINAAGINHYLATWGARGFRSGFMLHDRDCLHELEIEYDASTFDTDPFEPQPEGAQTIFPFWVSRPQGGGYVELPYTLAQDSTVFLVLKEKTLAIWKKKLEWIARRGGMVLVNVHPDYVRFGDGSLKASEYPASLYEEFLKHIKETYNDSLWHALPREVAGWYRETCVPAAKRQVVKPAPANLEDAKKFLKGGKVGVVLYSYYATDPRPKREAEALARAGMAVDVICLRKSSSEPWHEVINGVNVFHAPLKRRRAGKLVYMAQYAWFLLCAFCFLTLRSFRRRYRLVHVHNMPDFLVFSALVPKLFGAKVILDLHDPMPELFRSIYNLPEQHYVVRWLKKMERRSIGFAHQVLTPNLAFKKLFTSRSCPAGKIETVMNSPETRIFDPAKQPAADATGPEPRPFILMYHGLLVERHGLDLAIRAVAQLREKIPGLQLHMYGEPTDYSKTITSLVRELKLEDRVQSHGFKKLEEIAACISRIDVGVIPNRSSSFTEINFPTRIFEYLAMNKPVIVPNTQGIKDYFSEGEILFFKAGQVDDLARQMQWAFENPAGLREVLRRGHAIYEANNWDQEENKFLRLVGGLVRQG